MTRVVRSALVRSSAQTMFDLVNSVECYPRWFSWCEGASVLASDDSGVIARLHVRIAGLRTEFTTRNALDPGRSITLNLVEGPFRALSGRWEFTALAEQVCKVALTLDFEVAGRWVGSALASGFSGLADRMVDDFVREAKRADAG